MVGSLLVGYALSFKVVEIGPVSLGLYGIILVVDFFIQFGCAMMNRRSVDRIARRAGLDAHDAHAHAKDDDGMGMANEKAFASCCESRADISIAVVGYREDDGAWRRCLRSLQTQTLPPRAIIGVVDGDDAADVVMADAFKDEFRREEAKMVHVDVLLSEVYRDAYREALMASQRLGVGSGGRMGKVWRWLRNERTFEQVEAHRVARERIVKEVADWDALYGFSGASAVCFTQPHGHKRVGFFFG
jgi:hyaluronan synthase